MLKVHFTQLFLPCGRIAQNNRLLRTSLAKTTVIQSIAYKVCAALISFPFLFSEALLEFCFHSERVENTTGRLSCFCTGDGMSGKLSIDKQLPTSMHRK